MSKSDADGIGFAGPFHPEVTRANENKKCCKAAFLFSFAVRTGLEPATHGVTGRYSNQLNYRTIYWAAKLI